MLDLLPLQDSSGLHQAPCVRPASSSPFPGPQPRTQALQTGEGHTPQLGPVFLSSRLFCSFAALPAPHLRDVEGQELGSLWVPPCSRPWPWVLEPGHPQPSQGQARATPLPQPQEAEETLGKMLRPSRSHRAHQEGACGRGGPSTQHPVPGQRPEDGLLDTTCRSLRPETCWRGEGSPRGSQTSGRQATGAEALLRLLGSQAGPGPTESSGSLPPTPLPLPREPSPPPHPTPVPPDAS